MITPVFNRFLDNHIFDCRHSATPAPAPSRPTVEGTAPMEMAVEEVISMVGRTPALRPALRHPHADVVMGRRAEALMGAMPLLGIIRDVWMIEDRGTGADLDDGAYDALGIGICANLGGTAALALNGGNPALVAAGVVALAVSGICTATIYDASIREDAH